MCLGTALLEATFIVWKRYDSANEHMNWTPR
jgi:hypothetical protein